MLYETPSEIKQEILRRMNERLAKLRKDLNFAKYYQQQSEWQTANMRARLGEVLEWQDVISKMKVRPDPNIE